MPRPRLDSAEFPRLYSGSGQDSFGTVTGQHFKEDDVVDIVGRGSGNKKWRGAVTTRVAGDKWNAKVNRVTITSAVGEKARAGGVIVSPDATETVDVTVTNSDGKSNAVATDSDVP
jgi:hypothetical protein